MASLDTKEIYEESVIYGEDSNEEGFRKYLNEKMALVDSLFANPKINFIFPKNTEIIDSASNVHSFKKSKDIPSINQTFSSPDAFASR